MTIDNLKVDGVAAKVASPESNSRAISEKERKLMRDAFKLFDTDGDGTVTAKELKHVMDTLFHMNLSDEELDEMVKDVDQNGDGEVSFDEFADKIHEMINKLKDGAPSAPKNGKKSDNHWEALSTLITKYTTEAQENETKADKKRLIRSRKDRQKDNSTKEKSSQHNAMVAHFNLRRLSVEVDEDEIEQAMKAMQAESSKRLSKKVRRPMHPHSTFRRFWEVAILILVLFQAVYIPYTVSFKVVNDFGSSWWVFDLSTDVLFMMDLIMTFNVAIITPQNKLVLDRRIIAVTYLKSWFWLDLAASVPFDLIIQAASEEGFSDTGSENSGSNTAGATSLLKGFKLPRLLRLLKIMRLMRLVKIAKIRPEVVWWFQYSRHSNIIRLISLIVTILVLVHYMTCIFFPVMADVWFAREDCEEQTLPAFVDMVGSDNFDIDHPHYSDGVPLKSCYDALEDAKMSVYSTAFYHSMLLIQGEHINPKSTKEKFYCSTLILVGSLVLAMIFGNVSMYIANFSANSTAYQRKMEYLFESMNHLALPQQLKHRIIMYYDHIWKEYRSLDGRVHSFIPELSKQLESEVYLYLRTNLILSVPFLRQCSPEVVQRLVTILDTEVFLPNDYIVHKGVPGEEMYLISRGVCEVTVNDFVAAGPTPTKKKGQKSISDEERDSAMVSGRGSSGRDDKVGVLPESKPKKNNLVGRRRSSIVGAMSESLGVLAAKMADEKTKKEKKGWKRPERSVEGLLAENKTYSSRERQQSSNTVATVSVSRENSNQTVEGLSKSCDALSPRFSKRNLSFKEARKHSIDVIPAEADLLRNQFGEAEEKRKKSLAKINAIGSMLSGDTNNSNNDNEGDIKENESDTSGKNALMQTIRMPSRVGRVENRVAFPLRKGFSTNKVVSVMPGDDKGGSGNQSRRNTVTVRDISPKKPSALRRLSTATGAISKKIKGKKKEEAKAVAEEGEAAGDEDHHGITNLVKTEKVVKELLEGDYFGEIALILNTTRTCNVRAKNFVELHILKRDDFEEVVGKYAEERKLMEEIIMEKYKVEVSNLETKKRRDLKSEKVERDKMIKTTNENVMECRVMVETLQQQIALITQALVVGDVINVVGGAEVNSKVTQLNKRVNLLMGGSLRSLQSNGSEQMKADMLNVQTNQISPTNKGMCSTDNSSRDDDSPTSRDHADDGGHGEIALFERNSSRRLRATPPLVQIPEKTKTESESRRESLVSIAPGQRDELMSLPGSLPGLESVADAEEVSSNASVQESDSGRTVIRGNKGGNNKMKGALAEAKEVKEEDKEESFEDLVKSAGLDNVRGSGGDLGGE